MAAGKIYVYGEAGAAAQGGAAGFRYIGKLSEGKETWTNAEISNVNIKYDITGVTTTNYDEIKDECTYGLYAEGAKVSVDANGMITMSGLTAEQNYKSGTITLSTGTYNVTGSPVTWIGDGTTWSRTEGGTLQIQLGSKWVDALKGESATFTLTLSDGQTITAPIRIPA